jgi:hypothetical protein
MKMLKRVCTCSSLKIRQSIVGTSFGCRLKLKKRSSHLNFKHVQEPDATKDADRCRRMNELMNGGGRASAAQPERGGERRRHACSRIHYSARGGVSSSRPELDALHQILNMPQSEAGQLLQSIPPAQLQQLLSGVGVLDPMALLGGTPRPPATGLSAPTGPNMQQTPAAQYENLCM